MDSPKKTLPSLTPYKPPTNTPSRYASMLWAYWSRCKLIYALRISVVIQVPRLCSRGAAQQSMTAGKSRSNSTEKPPLRSVLLRLRVHLNSSGKRTALGSGDHHNTGCPGEYQGK